MDVTVTSLRRMLRRHRRMVTAVCAALVCGVVAHHAMPAGAMGAHGMDDHGAMAAMVVCLGLVVVAGTWAVGRLPRLRPLSRPTLATARSAPRPPASSLVPARARAGPLGPVVLRI